VTAVLSTLLVLGSWHLFAAVHAGGSRSTRAVLMGIGASGQVVVTLTLLGSVGWLTPTAAALATALLSGLLVWTTQRAAGRGALLTIFLTDWRALRTAVRGTCAWETVLLTGLLLFAGLWIVTAIRFYPPRGIDDVTYHLPEIYQSLQDHRLVLLPVALRGHFAYPLNGELLFLWVTLFTHAIRWVDAPQAVLWLFAFAAVFSLARRFALPPRGAFLAAALFTLMPVSLLQAPSNYVDVISSAWLLSAMVALLHYEEAGSRVGLALAGLATGLLAGTKASTLPLAALLVAFAAVVIWRGRRDGRRRAAQLGLFIAPMLTTCGYWYLRNWIVLGNPVYPYPVRVLGATVFAGPLEIGVNCWSAILADPREAIRIALWDPGLGSFHGGFGFLFWGFALPAIALTAVREVRDRSAGWVGRLLVLSLWPVGLATLFLVGRADLFVFARLVLSVGAPAFIAFALVIEETRRRLPGAATVLRALAVGSAATALVLMAGSRWPLMSLAPVAADSPRERAVSEFRYLAATAWDLRPMAGAWAPLDAITRAGAGLTVYQATDWPVFWTAPTYGAELQNRIWNFVQDPGHPPEAFLFHSWTGNPFYLGPTISRETVAANPQLRLVASERDGATTLYVSRSALAAKNRGGRLAEYYRITAPSMVSVTEESLGAMEAGSLLLAPFPFAAGYLVHEADGRLRAELHPIATKDQGPSSAAWPDRVIYTLGQAIAGRPGRIAATLQGSGSAVPLYRNAPASARGASAR
jgi:hypothetical protein